MLFRFEDFRLDAERRVLHSADGELVLQPRVFDLLVHLVRHRDRVVSKDELVEAVWEGAFVTDGAVQRAMSMLRAALRREGGGAMVRTYPRQGYRFCADVVEEPKREARPESPAPRALAVARDELAREDWDAALRKLREADAVDGLDGSDLECWGETAEYLGRLVDAVVPLERAVAAYSATGERCSAARVALRLANVQLERREVAVGGGWLRRAATYLQATAPCHEVALLEWLRSRFALFSGDFGEALARSEAARELACRMGDRDVEALGLLYSGLALVALGDFERGVGLLDESAATVMGERLGRWTGGIVYCGVIWGSLNRGDWRRASEWTDQFSRWCSVNAVCGYPGLCRLHQAEVHLQRGQLFEAERGAASAGVDLAAAIPFLEGDAHRLLGEIRLAGGDFEGAESAFLRAHELGWDPNPGFALLRLAQGQPEVALRCLEGALVAKDWAVLQRRGFLLAHLTRVAVAAGRLERAREAMAELDGNPKLWDTAAAAAAASSARGELALGENDPAAAVAHLRESVQRWREVGAPLKMAETRLRLALALAAAGDREGEQLERAAAATALEGLGAAAPAVAASALERRRGKSRA